MFLKNVVVFLFLGLLVNELAAQNSPAELIFKDGKIYKGFGKLTADNTIKFKPTKKAKKQSYSFDEVDTLKIVTKTKTEIYVKIKVKDKKTPKVLEVVEIGKNVILYQSKSQGYIVGAPGVGGGAPTGGRFYNISNSYVRKYGEDEVFHLGSDQLFTKNFKKAATDYFSDCHALVQKIKSKEFKKKHLKEIIVFYNESCK